MEAATHAVATVGGITGTVGYSWTVDGVVVPSENLVGEPIEPQRLILLEEYIGKQVVVTATVTPEGGSPVVLVSARAPSSRAPFS
ncbi:hypothetical protein G7085_14210 [Tessaracoccus sp. HDW20]|uniref:hypothetical protein n=1 Tax=Tessaracoccus coleopterorum TaxID=2714950 RepID=UPI0018D3539C|nr:hypothetical protein [Tessaracoccus coleopterorum]NHB85381.1 hypothetical protein [Tessaracoccus coleopterorum]